MANNPINKTLLVKGKEGESATDTTVPIGGIYMYDGVTTPEGYEEVESTTGTRLIKKITPSAEDTRPKVTDDLEYNENLEGTAYSIAAIQQVFNEYYPVGAIYISVNNINPAAIFGGTWEQIKDRYLVACGDTFNIEEEGGSDTATTYTGGYIDNTILTTNQLPAHNHSYNETGLVQGTALTIEQMPTHSHDFQVKAGENIQGGEDNNQYYRYWSETTEQTSSYGAVNTQAHYHARQLEEERTGRTGQYAGHAHIFTGAESTFNIMPKYIAVNVWYRTA